MSRQFLLYFCSIFLLGTLWTMAQIPDSFASHRVQKGETLEMLLEQYKITAEQLEEYNPLVTRFGIRRRMNLRIPIYSNTAVVQPEKPIQNPQNSTVSFTLHEVLPKETKWRL